MDETTIRTGDITDDIPFFALGIDVGKDTLELALLTPQQRLHTKSVRNTEAGFKALTTWIKRLTKPDTAVRLCLEASAGSLRRLRRRARPFLARTGLLCLGRQPPPDECLRRLAVAPLEDRPD